MRHVDQLRVLMHGRSVGVLAIDMSARIWFEYDPEWVAAGFDLSPRAIEFSTVPQIAKSNLFDGLHGVFNDSLPDGWGLLLMDREFRRRFDWAPATTSPLDRLAYIGSRAMGALEYEPAFEGESIRDEVDLRILAESSEAVLKGTASEVLNELRIVGGSPGGARPKVTIARSLDKATCLSGLNSLPTGYSHWIVKFRSEGDNPDMGALEKAYSEMARIAGIVMPTTDLIKVRRDKITERFFSVERFDRAGDGGRKHVLSLAGLLYANFRLPCLDYETVLQATMLLTQSAVEVERAYRLAVFNVLSHNKDDHAKNFSFIGSRDGWKLSPGFDLTYSNGMRGEHTTAILGHGNPGVETLLKLAQKFHIRRAEEIIGEVRFGVSQWSALAEDFGVSKRFAAEVGASLRAIDRRFCAITARHREYIADVAREAGPKG